MKEWSDEELDKLFRKSAEELDPPYESADWNNLRRRLDEADGITPGGGWLKKAGPWLAVGLFFLIGGLGVYYGTAGKEGKEKPSVARTRPTDQVPDAARAEAPDLSGRKAAFGSKEENRTKDGNSADPRPLSQAPGKSPIDTGRKNAHELKELPRSLASVSGVRDQPNRSEKERGSGAILFANKSPNQKLNIGGTSLRKSSLASRPAETEDLLTSQPVPGPGETSQGPGSGVPAGDTDGVANESALRESWPTLPTLANRSEYLPGTRFDYPVVSYAAPIENSVTDSKPLMRIPHWSIRVGVSPDLSVVRISDMMSLMQPGPSASLLVERGIGEKWTVQTGIIRSLKKYSVNMGDYKWPDTWKQNQMPVSVDGACQVFEIPLNIRYDLAHRPKTRWFIGAGASSYRMNNEKYVYNYKYDNDPTIKWRKKEASTGWYFLSHANASVGYERRLAERLSLVAEPYLRVPLRGVGFGKVNLFTGGVWFSLRYTPVYRK
jgi:hypothetical protein